MMTRMFRSCIIIVLCVLVYCNDEELPMLTEDMPCGDHGPERPMLVVNSHIAYSKPLHQLLQSLSSIGFAHFCRVLVVIGGSQQDVPPTRRGNITVIRSKLNAHDYTGLSALHVHRAVVAAPMYVYMHDTCLVHPRFLSYFNESIRLLGDNMFHTNEMGHSNVFAFSYRFVDTYGDAFTRKFTKWEAILMELNHTVRLLVPDQKMVVYGAAREELGEVDVYRTGLPRRMFYQPTFGIFKFIFFHYHGDIQGSVVQQVTEIPD